MGEGSQDRGTGWRTERGLVRGLAAFGAVLAAVLLAVSSAAAAASPAVTYKNATPINFQYDGVQACASGKFTTSLVDPSTGDGSILDTGTAKTCSAAKGGSTLFSEAYSESELGLIAPYKLTKPETAVNITWNIAGSASVSASGKLTHCPWDNYTGLVYEFNATGVLFLANYTENVQICEYEAFWEYELEPEVYDASTATYYFPTAYTFVYNETGAYYENETYYINATYPGWTNASVVNAVYTGSFGSPSSVSLTGTQTATVTGSWPKGSRLFVVAEAFVFGEAFIDGSPHSTAKFSWATGGSVGHLDVSSIVFS